MAIGRRFEAKHRKRTRIEGKEDPRTRVPRLLCRKKAKELDGAGPSSSKRDCPPKRGDKRRAKTLLLRIFTPPRVTVFFDLTQDRVAESFHRYASTFLAASEAYLEIKRVSRIETIETSTHRNAPRVVRIS